MRSVSRSTLIESIIEFNIRKAIKTMRDVATLLSLKEISILMQYLYMDESHFITIDNGVTKLEIRMSEKGFFHAKNLNFPDLPDLDYTDMMIVLNMLGIIEQLKETPPVEFIDFKSRWEELHATTLMNIVQNKVRLNKGRKK